MRKLTFLAQINLRRQAARRQKILTSTTCLRKSIFVSHSIQYGINFNDLPTWQKRGSGLYWQEYQKKGHNPKTGEDTVVTRNKIEIDLEIPMKNEYSQFIRDLLE